MAELIEHNDRSDFGGAFVIVPPGDGSAIEAFVIDPKQDAAHFFMLLSTKIAAALEEIKSRERNAHFGGR